MTSDHPTFRNTATRFTLIDQSLRGLSQIMLQDNALTGLLFLVGVFLGSFTMGIALVLSVLIATLAAHFLKYETADINKGLYGFNAALVGVALILLCKPTVIVWGYIVLGSILSTLVQHFFIQRKITVFTLPFVLVTWASVFLVSYFLPELTITSSPAILVNEIDFNFALRGYGQVIFQEILLSGILFFVAVLINAPLAALYGLLGSVIAALVSQFFSAPLENVNLGLVSYNAVLSALVFAGTKTKDALWALFSVVLSTLLSQLMTALPFAQLTFPFVVASCMALFLKNRFHKSEKNSN